MDFIQSLLLALVQGITEFLPISSSAHLILLPKIMQWQDQGVEIDIAVHIGTLLAVMLYFRKEVLSLIFGFFDCFSKENSARKGLFINLVVATIPVVIAGFLLKTLIEDDFRSALIIGVTSIVFGILLFLADRKAEENHKVIEGMPIKDAFLIGLSQMVALVPGVSRSGITMTSALFLGYSRTASAKFSLLLSMPTIFAAGTLIVFEMLKSPNPVQTQDALLSGAMAFIFGYLAIWGMMSWLKKSSFTPFVIYRVLLGVAILGFLM